MNEFVDECRREWRRLGVPDPVANEMAADLTADLEEAEAEGGSPEDVLGNSAFDPRRFAGAWAAARGVTSPPVPDCPSLWRPPVTIALAVLLGVMFVGAGLALFVGRSSSSIAFATRRIVPGPGGPIPVFGPNPGRVVIGPFAGPNIAAVVHPLAWLVFIVCVLGLGASAAWYWLHGSGPLRFRRRGGTRTQGWY